LIIYLLETKSKPLTLEKLAPKPQNGQPVTQPKEEKKNRAVPGLEFCMNTCHVRV